MANLNTDYVAMAAALSNQTLVLYFNGSLLEDQSFRSETERLFQLGVPLAQIRDYSARSAEFINYDYLFIRCPDGRTDEQVLALVLGARQTALILETKQKGGEFVIESQTVLKVKLSERIPVEAVTIRADMEEINAFLANIGQ